MPRNLCATGIVAPYDWDCCLESDAPLTFKELLLVRLLESDSSGFLQRRISCKSYACRCRQGRSDEPSGPNEPPYSPSSGRELLACEPYGNEGDTAAGQ